MSEDIVRMARESRLTDPDLGDWVTDYGDAENAIMKFAAFVAAAEREACAKVCEGLADKHGWKGSYAAECAAYIRSRGNI